MSEGFNAALFNELMDSLPPRWPAEGITRRGVLLGLVAAPFVIRTQGLLMPVRDRTLLSARELELQTMYGLRDYKKYPPTVAEVIAWRQDLTRLLSRCTVSWTGEGWAHIHRMSEAEKNYEAMGLL